MHQLLSWTSRGKPSSHRELWVVWLNSSGASKGWLYLLISIILYKNFFSFFVSFFFSAERQFLLLEFLCLPNKFQLAPAFFPQLLSFFLYRKINWYWLVTVKKLSGKRMDQITFLNPAPLLEKSKYSIFRRLDYPCWKPYWQEWLVKGHRAQKADSSVANTGKTPTHPDSQPKKTQCWAFKSNFSWSWHNLTVITSYSPVNMGVQYYTTLPTFPGVQILQVFTFLHSPPLHKVNLPRHCICLFSLSSLSN